VNPSTSAARDIYNQQNSLLKERAIAAISQTSGLVYFYKAGEPFSERMAEVVSDFANGYQMTVIPIAMTDRFSPLFPNSRVDSGQANQMGVKHIPAVFALNPISKTTMPIAYGLISQSELKEHILMATKAFQSGGYHAQ
jgi:conjugal transfer pilus assembly protein TraF